MALHEDRYVRPRGLLSVDGDDYIINIESGGKGARIWPNAGYLGLLPRLLTEIDAELRSMWAKGATEAEARRARPSEVSGKPRGLKDFRPFSRPRLPTDPDMQDYRIRLL